MGVFRFLFVIALVIPVGGVMLFYLSKLIRELGKMPKQTSDDIDMGVSDLPKKKKKRKSGTSKASTEKARKNPGNPQMDPVRPHREAESDYDIRREFSPERPERPPAFEYDRSAYENYKRNRALKERAENKNRTTGKKTKKRAEAKSVKGKSKRQRRKERQSKRKEREQR